MASVASRPSLNLPREGKLGTTIALPRLLGGLGIVGASGLLDIKRKKLVRRFVLEAGRLDALVSNAREDRLADWLLVNVKLRTDHATRIATIGENTPGFFTAGALAAASGLAENEVQAYAREHLVAVLAESSEWKDATFTVSPGHVPLGAEPRIGLPAAQAALLLARQVKAARRPRVPAYLRAMVDEAALSWLEVTDYERAALLLCVNGCAAPDVSRQATAFPRAEMEAAVEILALAGLVAEAEAPKPVAAVPEGVDDRVTTEHDVLTFLGAAEREDFWGLLDVTRGAKPEDVRKAYYRIVWRYHPDRFREGPFVRYLPRVEAAFRIVNEALEVLTDPQALVRWEQNKQKIAAKADPQQAARALLSTAKRSLDKGMRVEAAELLAQALERGGGDADCACALGCLLLGNPRRRNDALAMIARVAAEHPSRADFAAVYALALRKADQEDASKSALERARGINPTEVFVRAAQGDASAIAEVRKDSIFAVVLP